MGGGWDPGSMGGEGGTLGVWGVRGGTLGVWGGGSHNGLHNSLFV